MAYMKRIIKDLDVDFVGGQDALTVEEDNAISAYLLQQKLLRISSIKVKSRTVKRSKTVF
jgi:hypothetical protein